MTSDAQLICVGSKCSILQDQQGCQIDLFFLSKNITPTEFQCLLHPNVYGTALRVKSERWFCEEWGGLLKTLDRESNIAMKELRFFGLFVRMNYPPYPRCRLIH